MKNFQHFGIKQRVYPEYNYHAVWSNLKTVRLGTGSAKELPPDHSEFYDVSLGTKCNLQCPFCYVAATKSGKFYKNIVEKAEEFFGKMSENQKPFQIAIGSEGEPTIHPQFKEFVEKVYELGIVPNYTTNGITLAKGDWYTNNLLDLTEKYCGGVAVSANNFNWEIDGVWRMAVDRLLSIDVYTNLHIIIKDKQSVERLKEIYDTYGDKIHTYVLLPMMPEGRSTESVSRETYQDLCNLFQQIEHKDHFAFGANFYPFIIDGSYENQIQCSLYEPESFSKNLILDDPIRITPSSFNRKTTLYEKNI